MYNIRAYFGYPPEYIESLVFSHDNLAFAREKAVAWLGERLEENPDLATKPCGIVMEEFGRVPRLLLNNNRNKKSAKATRREEEIKKLTKGS